MSIMNKLFKEIGYQAIVKAQRMFICANKMYNMALNMDVDNHEIRDIVETINRLRYLIQKGSFVGKGRKLFQNRLYVEHMLLIRTIILQTTSDAATEERGVNYRLGNIVNFIHAKTLHDILEKNEKLRMKMKVYQLLLHGDRENLSMQRAFDNLNACIKEFSMFVENCTPRAIVVNGKDSKLREAIDDLLRHCILTTTVEGYPDEVLVEYSYVQIFNCLCEDIIVGRFYYVAIRKCLREVFK